MPLDTTPPAPNEAAAELDHTFRTVRSEGRAALAAYLPVGYPTFRQSLATLHALGQHAEVLELGVPYSDPLLDGPTIQLATAQALRAGFRLHHLFAAVRELRASSPASLLIMTYWQPVAHYGPDRFSADLVQAGAAGAIIPDLPLEEAQPWLLAARTHGLHTVPLVAPHAHTARLASVCAAATGMIYVPAARAVSGHTGPLDPGLPHTVERLRGITTLPIAVGIGLSTAEAAAQVSHYADAVIVGSALIRLLQATPGPAGIAAAAALASELAAGARSPTRAAA
ncbi:tryptophan synthase subunit alpha [Streptomyces sp. NPDC004647]|uniref:tryptophan synthase subunit alpha n=1 Tax=Streptomyces sp. NPDC004647 TaxID=3154671 RepID=UPI0033BE089E